MATHYNIQVVIQQVTVESVDSKQARGFSQQISGKDRRVVDLLRTTVTAETLDRACEKAKRLIDVEQEIGGPGDVQARERA